MATAVSTGNTANNDSTPPPPPTKAKGSTADAHINGIVDQISGLTLLQAADLVAALKVRMIVTSTAC
jgi:large subunit ribosomal protein L7/L12